MATRGRLATSRGCSGDDREVTATKRHRTAILEGLVQLSLAARKDFCRVSCADMPAKDKRYFKTVFSTLANEAEKYRAQMVMIMAAMDDVDDTTHTAIATTKLHQMAAVLDTYGHLYRLEAQYNKCLRRYMGVLASRHENAARGFFYKLRKCLCFFCYRNDD